MSTYAINISFTFIKSYNFPFTPFVFLYGKAELFTAAGQNTVLTSVGSHLSGISGRARGDGFLNSFVGRSDKPNSGLTRSEKTRVKCICFVEYDQWCILRAINGRFNLLKTSGNISCFLLRRLCYLLLALSKKMYIHCVSAHARFASLQVRLRPPRRVDCLAQIIFVANNTAQIFLYVIDPVDQNKYNGLNQVSALEKDGDTL